MAVYNVLEGQLAIQRQNNQNQLAQLEQQKYQQERAKMGQLGQILPKAYGGDQNALAQLAMIDPGTYIETQKALTEQQGKLAKQIVISAATGQITPENFEQYKAMAVQAGIPNAQNATYEDVGRITQAVSGRFSPQDLVALQTLQQTTQAQGAYGLGGGAQTPSIGSSQPMNNAGAQGNLLASVVNLEGQSLAQPDVNAPPPAAGQYQNQISQGSSAQGYIGSLDPSQRRQHAMAAMKKGLSEIDYAQEIVGKRDENKNKTNAALAEKRLEQFQDGADKLSSILPDIQAMAEISDASPQGATAGVELIFKQALAGLGQDVSGLKEGELFQSISSRLAPSMRAPGSGASSDRDVTLFLNSLPRLTQSSEGRKLIAAYFTKIAERRSQQAAIAESLFNETGRIDTGELKKRLDTLGPIFSEEEKGALNLQSSQSMPGVQPSAQFDAEAAKRAGYTDDEISAFKRMRGIQ